MFFLLLEIAVYMQRFSATTCTIDVDTKVYEDIATQLTLNECRELVASLRCTTYEFPSLFKKGNSDSIRAIENYSSSNKAEEQDNICLKLLIEWDKKEGKDSTHELIERRLRQMNKIELADWLGITVFHQLASDINDTLFQNPFADSNEELALNAKLLEDKPLLRVDDKLTLFDYGLWTLLITLLVILLLVCCRLLQLTFTRTKVTNTKVGEELKNLLHNEYSSED